MDIVLLRVISRLEWAKRLARKGKQLCPDLSSTVIFLVFLFSIFPSAVFGINAPTITKVAGQAVAPDTTIFVPSTTLTLEGNAEAATQIRLFRGTSQIATGTTSGAGVWSIPLTGQPQGSFEFSAMAYDSIFLSQQSVGVDVVIDTTLPSMGLWYGNSGCRSNQKYQCNIGLIYANVSDSLAGIDFSTASISVDFADMPTTGNPDDYTVVSWTPIPGTISDDGSGQVNFYPADWGLIRQPYRKIRLSGSISDKAGNETVQSKTFYMHYDARPVAPIIDKIYDPGHNLFTGDGETAANIPVAGWVDYFPNMTVATNPIKIKGHVTKWNEEWKGWDSAYIGDENYIRRRLYLINQSTGEFELTYPGLVFPFGDIRLDVRAGDSADCLGRTPAYVYIKTLEGTPFPVKTRVPSGEPAIIGSRLWPTVTGTVTKMPFRQTVQIGFGDYSYTTWLPQYSQVILPEGQTSVNTPGAYDDGDVWYDANNNGEWDSGENFYDMPSALSDGESFTLINFLNVEYNHNTLTYIGALVRNNLGKSSAIRVVRAHNNDTYPPLLNGVSLSPAHTSAYRRTSERPNLLTVKAQTWGGNYSGGWSWSGHYYLNGTASTVNLRNGQGTLLSLPAPSWSHLGNLAFQTDIDLTSVALPEGTYQIEINLEDNLTNLTQNSSNSFKIDDTPPYATDIVPADGALSNSFTSFNAKVVDPNLADGSAGSGANIDVSKPQIWPFRLLSLPSKVTLNGRNTWTFTLTDSELVPTDHKGTNLSVGDTVQIWITSSGLYDSTAVEGTVDTINGDGTFKVKHPGTYTRNSFYVITYPIPFFTSNNGLDRVGAVPISPVSADGTYVTKVVTRDRADNTGTFFTTSSPLEVPVGLITYSFDQPFLLSGLIPADIGTFTTSAVTTRKGNPVQDGQPLSLVQIPGNLSSIIPADANGIPGDGHQVLFGQNGAAPGSGQACFGIKATTAVPGSISVYGAIGLASGTSSPLAINQIDTYTLSAVSTSLDITPSAPSPSTRVSTAYLGKAPRNVPDGSLATCTTNFGTLSPDDSSDLAGVQSSVINASASTVITSNTKGTATVGIQIGGRSSNINVTFNDKYPPPAPTGLTISPQATNTGASTLSWNASTDIGGAGTIDYSIGQSANGGAPVFIATTTTLSLNLSGLADGSYEYKVCARDNDGNIGALSAKSLPLVIDRVAPPAVACSDIGPGNTDPDEHFSVDSNVYFYFSPTDDRSGVDDCQVQVSVTPDTSGLVEEPWVGPSSPYIFMNGQNTQTYYARVRVKDKAGNIGNWGSWSNGIVVNITGAVTPPNAPTITKVDGKNAVPGVPVPTNKTTGITVQGLSEASNLIQIFIDGVYSKSVISNGSGAFSTTISLSAGNHSIKVKANNGFAESGFSNTISIVVDTTNPVMTRRIYDTHGYVRGENYLGTLRSDHNLNTIDFYLSDSGGSNFDVNTAVITLTDIDNSGNPVPAVGTYTNPVSSSINVIAADRLRLEPTVPWKECLQTFHRYRLAYQISDKAGNTKSYSFDFVIDNTKPGEIAEVPADTVPANCNIKSLYVYDMEAIPWPNWPTLADLVEYKWNAASGAYMIDPAAVNPALIDTTTEPHSLKFNTVAFYGNLYAADITQPSASAGVDSKSHTFALAWGYSCSIAAGPDSIGNSNYFRFPFRTLANGLNSHTLVDQDWAICRNNYPIKLWISSPNPAPSPPTAIEFSNAADPSMIYPIWTNYGNLFGTTGGTIHNKEVIITDNSNAMLIKVTVPVELFPQTVELVQGGSVTASAVVSANNDTALLSIDQAGASGNTNFQIRSFANTYYSTNLPRYLNYWEYYWVKGDTTAPTTFDTFPTETFYNALSGADARPFPSQFSVKAKDTSDGSTLSFLEIGATSITFQDGGGTAVPGTLYKDYDTSNMTYGYRYVLSSIPTAEGTYYYRLTLPDAARPTSHTTNSEFPFKLDKTPPVPSEVNPSDGSVTNSLPSFNAKIADPLLADGTTGSGANMDPSRVQIYPFKSVGQAVAATTNSLTAVVSGIDTTATDHVDNPLTVGTAVWFAKSLGGGQLEFPTTSGVISANGGDSISANVTAGPALSIGTTYSIIYEIPNFPSNDGIDRVAAVPIQPAVKGGSYLVFLKLIDNALNQGTYSSVSSIYEAAYGTFTLTPSRTSLYVGLYPPHTSNYVSSPILTTEGNPINVNTEITLLTNRGSFSPADSNGIPGDGHQVKSDAAGKISFGLQATGLSTGIANVRAVLGLASGTDSSISLVQIPVVSLNWATDTLIISPTTPNPSVSAVTSAIGNSGDLVPNGTCVNLYNDLGTFSPADAYPLIDAHQIQATLGIANFALSSTKAGVASVTFEVGGRILTKNITFLDRYPPNPPGQPIPDNTLNNNGVFNLIWSASTDPAESGIAEYEIQYSLNAAPYVYLASTTTTGFLTSGLAQGDYTFRVRAVDGAGNVGDFGATSVSVKVDTTAPLGTISINSGAARTGTESVSLTLSATDDQGVADMSFSNDNITWSAWVPYGTTQNWSLSTGDGTKVVYARYRDTVGNIGIFTDDIILDTTGPLGGVTVTPAPFSATGTLSLNLSASDGSGVNLMALSLDGGAFVSQAYSPAYDWNVASGFATHTVQVKYYDSLGNESAVFTSSTCVDTIVPTTPSVTDDGTYSPFIDKLHASWTSSDAQTGISYYLVKVGTSAGAGDTVAEVNVGVATETTFSSLSLDIGGSTLYYFTVCAIDKAGNISAFGNSDGIKAGDPTPPDPVIVTDDGNYTGNSTQLHATWTASNDSDSGINRYEFSAGTSAGAADVVTWTNLGIALSNTATGLALTNGTQYWINVRIYNNGGTSTVSSSNGIIVDTAAPPVPTMSAEPTYSSGTANIVSCAAVTDALSGGVLYNFQSATNTGFTASLVSSGWISNPTHTFSGLTHGTTYYFRVQSKDAVGNVSAFSGSVNSIQDSNAPSATNYTDNTALNADPDYVWTRDTSVSFVPTSLSDDLSGVKNVYVEIATETAFTNTLYASWLSNTSGALTTSVGAADGDKIYARAKFEDIAGNISGWFTTDGITLDQTAPTANATTDIVGGNNDPNDEISIDTNLYFSFSHSDAVSGVADVRIQVATDNGFTAIATDVWLGTTVTSYLYKFGADGSTYYARILVKDNAGRESAFAARSNGIRVDMSAPNPTTGKMFYINKKPGANLSELTTATETVFITLTIDDPSGVASATISNDGVSWTTWDLPANDPASYPWVLDSVPGTKTIHMKFRDKVGNTSSEFTETIDFYPGFVIHTGLKDDSTYPVDTYDEYSGQNKYGTDRTKTDSPTEGRSLILKTP